MNVPVNTSLSTAVYVMGFLYLLHHLVSSVKNKLCSTEENMVGNN